MVFAFNGGSFSRATLLRIMVGPPSCQVTTAQTHEFVKYFYDFHYNLVTSSKLYDLVLIILLYNCIT